MTTDVQVAAPVTIGDGAPAPGGPASGTEPTQPAAPAASPAPAPTPAAAPTPAPAPGFEPTGNAGLDLALEFVGGLGLGPGHPAVVAAEEGNFALLEAALGAMGDKAKGWERYATLAKDAWGQVKQAAEAKAAEQKRVVTDAVGGEETWSKIQAWAAANAEPGERAAVNTALAAGGIAAKAMAQYLKGLYENAPGTTIAPRNPTPNDVSNSAAVNTGLSAKDYADAVQNLSRQLGGRMEGSREYAALQDRRAAGKRAGL